MVLSSLLLVISGKWSIFISRNPPVLRLLAEPVDLAVLSHDDVAQRLPGDCILYHDGLLWLVMPMAAQSDGFTLGANRHSRTVVRHRFLISEAPYSTMFGPG